MSVGTPQRSATWIQPRTARSSENPRVQGCCGVDREESVRASAAGRGEGLWRHRKRAFLRWREKKKRPRSEETVGNYGVEPLFSVELGLSKGQAGDQV